MLRFLFSALALFSLSTAYAGFNLVAENEVTATITSTKWLNANVGRRYLMIQNHGATSIIVKLGAVQSSTEGVVIVAGGNWEPAVAPVEAVWGESASSTDSITIIEGK